MKTLPPLRAMIVDEAEAVAIIDYCLFGTCELRPRAVRPARAKKTRRAGHPTPPQVTPLANVHVLDIVVLRKHAQAQTPPVTTERVKEIPALWQPCRGLSFPSGLCYLQAVQEHNWPSATVELGKFPSVSALLCSLLVEKFSGFLVEQRPGLYHMVGQYVAGATTLFHAQPLWAVGAHLPNRPHPGHHAGYPQRPLYPQQPPLPPQSMVAPAVPLGVPTPKQWAKRKDKPQRAPFQLYSTAQQDRHPSSLTTKWRAALTDPLDDAMESFKQDLDIFPSSLAIPAWKDLQSHLREMKKQLGFDRKVCIPDITEFFSTVLERVRAEMSAMQEDEKLREEILTQESAKLVGLVTQFREVQASLENPMPGMDISETRRLAQTLAKQVEDQEKMVDMLDGSENPADTDMGDDPLADGASFVKVPNKAPPEKIPHPTAKELWPETNYQDYATRVAPLFPAPDGKVPLDSLFVKMEELVDSKLYLPRPLELYTMEELSKVVPRGMPQWNNRYEDPMEPAKSWTWEEFSEIYSKPGYHFMLARVAQVGPQCKDPKLSTLCSKLATRWKCSVALQKMDPRQDWMLCTVPSKSDGEKDALKYDLIRLSEGNAVYVIRRFAPAGRA